MNRKSEQGVALVVTLILLSVITFMAVTFLVVSRHEGAAVDTVTQQSNAKLAAESALEQAKGQMIADMLARTNGYDFGLFVSTNYVSQGFFRANTNLTNVGYVANGVYAYDGTGLPLKQNDLAIMLNNLLVLPRAPVFVSNRITGKVDFRFYHDLNRNGAYDTNGTIVEKDALNNFVTNTYVGDPEWIGILDHPDQRHSASNFFVARYCFIAVPVGNALDVNYIHNQAKSAVTGLGTEGYLRDQGVGSWEINLAGFLHELNTNAWDNKAGYPSGAPTFIQPGTSYQYNPLSGIGGINRGDSFADAASFVDYRYAFDYNNLHSFQQLYPGATNPFQGDYIDEFMLPRNGNTILTGIQYPPSSLDIDSSRQNTKWLGDDSTNRFYNTQDFYTLVPKENNNQSPSTTATFTNRLFQIGSAYNASGSGPVNSYNRYTFYRMLAQLGFDSAPESTWAYPAPPYQTNATKLNINYNNVDNYTNTTTGTVYPPGSTNFMPWTPLAFFTNAADRMLHETFPVPVVVTNNGTNVVINLATTNIPIWPVNYYTPAVHRLLQLSANIYDASTTNIYPSVFRPVFYRTNNYIYICGYINTYSNADYQQLPLGFEMLPSRLALGTTVTNVYGIPWVIGAKKGFPNLNQVQLGMDFQMQRQVQLVKANQGPVTNTTKTNIQYQLAISNAILVQAWNSYTNAFSNSVRIVGVNATSMTLSNEVLGLFSYTNTYGAFTTRFDTNITLWPGFNPTNIHLARYSFVDVLSTNIVMLTNAVYLGGGGPSAAYLTSATNFYNSALYTALAPTFRMGMTNRLQFAMVVTDANGQHLVDYVNFDMGNMDRTNLTAEAFNTLNDPNYKGYGGNWDTNFYKGMVAGISNQINISLGGGGALGTNAANKIVWNSVFTKQYETNNFALFYKGNSLTVTNTLMQAPYSPAIKLGFTNVWEANDPLVHYMLPDMNVLHSAKPVNHLYTNGMSLAPIVTLITPSKGSVNSHYLPWGDNGYAGDGNTEAFNYSQNNIGVKDIMITGSDDWWFPSNKYPNIGWLGRVHRGSPWQTVFLKSANTYYGTNYTNVLSVTNWVAWSGNDWIYPQWKVSAVSAGFTIPGYPDSHDAYISMPDKDAKLLDLFTTSPNDAASKGQLSVNQTNLASWAAVLYGVNVLSGTGPGQNQFISPGDSSPSNGLTALQYMVNGINFARTNQYAQPGATAGTTNYFYYNPGGVFTSVGQLLSVPELTTQSPYVVSVSPTNILRDEVIERIPQQIMSLVRVGSPRYVVFAYGQSLKPADRSILTTGPMFGMCTNYQVTGESGIRAVVRVDNAPFPSAPGITNVFSPHAVVESFDLLGTE